MKRWWSIMVVLVFCGGVLMSVSHLMAQDAFTPHESVDLEQSILIGGRSDRLRNANCMTCHSLVKQPEGREQAAHSDVRMKHGEFNDTCFNCHDQSQVNRIVVGVKNESVPFEDSYRLCSQCHGNILKDWNSGIHGSQTGQWNGVKVRKTCSACHDPHDPAFKPMKPLPPPLKPKEH